ncbi:hypothetical protein D3C81_1599870 [compost metagenome]
MRFRKKPAHAIQKPIDLGARAQEDAAQDETEAALRMRLPICQRQRRTPRATEYQPLLYAQHRTQGFNVGDQQLRGVIAILAERRRFAGAALIK